MSRSSLSTGRANVDGERVVPSGVSARDLVCVRCDRSTLVFEPQGERVLADEFVCGECLQARGWHASEVGTTGQAERFDVGSGAPPVPTTDDVDEGEDMPLPEVKRTPIVACCPRCDRDIVVSDNRVWLDVPAEEWDGGRVQWTLGWLGDMVIASAGSADERGMAHAMHEHQPQENF